MAIEDWKGYIVANGFNPELQNFGGYHRIFQGLGITDLEIVRFNDSNQECAKKLGELVRKSSKKPFVTCFGHDLITYLTDDTVDHVYFDAHSDDYSSDDFNHGSFINFMQGRHICIGAREIDYPNRPDRNTTLLRCEDTDTIRSFPFRDRIFLSIDTDVFHPSVTTAHTIGEMTPYEGRLFPYQVRELLKIVTQKSETSGIALTEYFPFYENDLTDEIFISLLRDFI
ncbi:hypothetical protein GOV12_03000 [Candidatus Pacearchaeota archaeon]|nr:hypothetical protein [Candidatus Pacearchaeota archaeon]